MRNRFEKKIAAELGPNYSYEPIKLKYVVEHHYTPDFVDGFDIVETKGYFPPEDRRKMKAVRDQHPEYNITIVFQNPDLKLNKRSKTSYADWCRKNNIGWRKG